jgi:hypothetical protein
MIKRLSRYEIWIALILIVVTGIIFYAPLLRQLGLYKEDWWIFWSGDTQGPLSLIPLFKIDRPLTGYVYATIYPILGNLPFHWHSYALFLRLLGIIVFFLTLRKVWPDKKLETTIIALLFLCYPGFLQQSEAVVFSNHFTSLSIVLISISLTIYSVYVTNLFGILLLNVLAAALILVYPLLMEYFIGLEGLRLVLLWAALQNKSPLPFVQSLLRLLKYWSIYLVMTGIYLFWRLFIFNSTRPTTNIGRLVSTYQQNAPHVGLSFIVNLAKNILETTIMAWVVPLYNYLFQGSLTNLVIAAILALVAALLIWLYYQFLKKNEQLSPDWSEESSSNRHFFWLGLVIVVLTLAPIVVADRNVLFVDREDRFSLPVATGVAILVIGFLAYVIKPKLRIWVLLALIGLASFPHFYRALYMSDFWTIQRDLWWQLSWRAPQLKPGTLLLVNLPPGFSFAEGYEAWAPADLVYYPQEGAPPITAEVLNNEFALEVFRGGLDPKNHRGIIVNRDFDQPLVLSQATSQSCLNVIDNRKIELSQDEDPLVRLVAPYSKIDLILTDQAFKEPDAEIFGAEPEHTWCYYYQKASYARQMGDWAEVVRLGDEARKKGLSPVDRFEWMPFLEGYASLGRDKDARNLAAIVKTEPGARNPICAQLNAARPAYPGNYDYENVVQILCGS